MSWFMTSGPAEFLSVTGDLLRAEPASNALYERLGYRAVEDRVVLSFEPPVTLHP